MVHKINSIQNSNNGEIVVIFQEHSYKEFEWIMIKEFEWIMMYIVHLLDNVHA